MNTATDLASVLRRSAKLEEDLVAFGEGRSFERFLDPLLTEAAGPEGALDEATAINVIDRFLLQYRLPDGTTVADRFAIRRTDLTDTDRQMVLAWRDPVEALFEVRGKDRDCLLPAQPAGRPGVPDLHQRRAGGFPRGHARRLPRRPTGSPDAGARHVARLRCRVLVPPNRRAGGRLLRRRKPWYYASEPRPETP
jgi:hypothetical protein